MDISEERKRQIQEIKNRRSGTNTESNFDRQRRESLERRLSPAVGGLNPDGSRSEGLLRGDGTRNTGGQLSKDFGALSRIGQPLDGSRSGKDKLLMNRGGRSNKTIPETFSHLQNQRPSMGEGEDPKDFQIREARWETSQATKQANSIAKTTMGIRGQQENQQRQDTENMFQTRGQDTPATIRGAGRVLNPEFNKLTEEERALNRGLPQGQRVEQFVEFSEDDLSQEQRTAMASGTNVMFTDEQRQAKFDQSVSKTFIDPITGKAVKGGTAENLFRVKELLDAETGDKLAVNDDGTYYLRDEEGEEVDPIKRAENKVREEEIEARDNLKESNRVATDRIKSLHRTADGGITNQGKKELQRLQVRYNKAETNLNKDVDGALDKAIRSEKSRQIEVDTQLEGLRSTAEKPKSFAQEISSAKVSRLNALKLQGIGDFEALAQVEREYAEIKQDPKKLEMSKIVDDMEARDAEPADIFTSLYDKSKNVDEAYSVLKGRYGVARAKDIKNEYLRSIGNDEDSIEEEDYADTIKSLYNGELGGYLGLTRLVSESRSLKMPDDFILSQLEILGNSPTADPMTKIMAGTFAKSLAPEGQEFEFKTVGKSAYKFNPATGETELITGGSGSSGATSTPSAIIAPKLSTGEIQSSLEGFAPDIAKAAEDIISPTSQLKLSDISVRGNRRESVSRALSVLKKRAIEKGDMGGIMSASAGGKAPDASFNNSFEKGLTVLSQLGELTTSLDGEATGPIWGSIRSKNPFDVKAKQIQAQLTAIIPNLARGVFGEVGVLTDNDVKLYRETLPNLKSQEELSNALLGITVRTVQRSLENKIRLNAGTGRDMSGLGFIYEDIVRQADALLAPLEAIQGGEQAQEPEQSSTQLEVADLTNAGLGQYEEEIRGLSPEDGVLFIADFRLQPNLSKFIEEFGLDEYINSLR